MLTAHQTAKNTLLISGDVSIALGTNQVFEQLAKTEDPFIVAEPRFVLVKSGWIHVTINLVEYHIHTGMMAYIGSGSIVQIHGYDNIKPFDGLGIIMSDERLNIAMHGRMLQSLNGTERSFCIEATDDEQQVVQKIAEALWATLKLSRPSENSINALIAAFAHTVDEMCQKHTDMHQNNLSRKRNIFEHFISLVNRHSTEQHQMKFYADKLCISDKYLSTVVKQTSGTSAKEWIDHSLTTNAKVMLRHTDLQVSQVADRLSFPNVSFFCKYFKRTTGYTPLEYRDTASKI